MLIQYQILQTDVIRIVWKTAEKKITVISGRLPARPITHTGRLLHTAKKKVNGLPAPVDNPHVVIQLFRWRKRDIKAIHFSLSIQTCAQFCVNISLYFIDKIIQ